MSGDPKRVFYLSSPSQIFMKLDWEIDNLLMTLKEQESEFKSHEVAAYQAFNTAVTAWHLTDWTWNSIPDEAKKKLSIDFSFDLVGSHSHDFKSFQSALINKSQALAICWDICSGSKHFDMHKNSKVDAKVEFKVKNATAGEFRAGQPLQRFSYDFLVVWRGQTFRAVDIFSEARDFWMQLLANLQIIGPIFVKMNFDIKVVRRNGKVE